MKIDNIVMKLQKVRVTGQSKWDKKIIVKEVWKIEDLPINSETDIYTRKVEFCSFQTLVEHYGSFNIDIAIESEE